ncbi:MAG: hypothetical protein HYT70_02190 [Candidatus Aenigmarchaeota archaeon]|nr:hypothetical protein [Candidatus Aenigmarchaeota archaeon]
MSMLEYAKSLYEVFRGWDRESDGITRDENPYSYRKERWSYLHYVRDVFVKVGGYLPRIPNGIILGMTDGIRNIVLRHAGDEKTLDHELGHIMGYDEYTIRLKMAAGWRAPRRMFRLHFI